MEMKNVQLKEINSEHKERLEKHKKTMEGNIEKVTIREKTTKERIAIRKEVTKKKAIYKKAMNDKRKIASEKIMDDTNKEKINIGKNSEEEPEELKESKVAITDEERAERFKRLHTIAEDMMKNYHKL